MKQLASETTRVTIMHHKANFYGVFDNELLGVRKLNELGIKWRGIKAIRIFDVAPYFRSKRIIKTIELE